MDQTFLYVIISDDIFFTIFLLVLYCIAFQISLRPARDSMAASQRPGFSGRSQTPPAQKPLVRMFFCKTLFLSLETVSVLCTVLLLSLLVFNYVLFHC